MQKDESILGDRWPCSNTTVTSEDQMETPSQVQNTHGTDINRRATVGHAFCRTESLPALSDTDPFHDSVRNKFKCMHFSLRNLFLQRLSASLEKDAMGAHLRVFFDLEFLQRHTQSDASTSIAEDTFREYCGRTCVTLIF